MMTKEVVILTQNYQKLMIYIGQNKRNFASNNKEFNRNNEQFKQNKLTLTDIKQNIRRRLENILMKEKVMHFMIHVF